MIAVIQRVTDAVVEVQTENSRAAIGHGLCVLLCVEHGDDDAAAKWMANKLVHLRIFSDDEGKMNRSVLDAAGEILLISQFTLAGDVSKGHRPSFVGAAPPEVGERLCERVAELMRDEHKLDVKTGRFGAKMLVTIRNDGPVTIIVRTP